MRFTMKKLLILTLITTSMVLAQGPGYGKGKGHGGKVDCPHNDKRCDKMSKGPRFEKLIAHLELDQKTQDAVEVLLTDFHKKKYLLKLESEEHKIALKKMIVNDQFEMGAIKKNCHKRGDIWAEMQILKFEKDAEIKKLLTQKQWDKYLMHRIKSMDKEGKGKRGGKGKGKSNGRGRGWQ